MLLCAALHAPAHAVDILAQTTADVTVLPCFIFSRKRVAVR
jgi:hypothetical protein